MKIYARDWPRSIVVEVGPDRKDDPERDRDFFFERLNSGKLSAPRMPKKNDLYRTVNRRGRGGRMVPIKIVTPAHLVFRQVIAEACYEIEPMLGPCSLAIEQHYGGSKRMIAGVTYPGMDSDACLAAVRDAIQAPKRSKGAQVHPSYQGLILDDGQIRSDKTLGVHTPGVWMLRIELTAMGADM